MKWTGEDGYNFQFLIDAGSVTCNGKKVKKRVIPNLGDEIQVFFLACPEIKLTPENIPLDIIFEDEHMLVINKPVGLVVHPGAGNHTGTIVNALLHHCAESLSGIGGVMRPGIVHRLDKDTSGLMVVAKSDNAHQGLAAQLEDRSLSRIYEDLVLGIPIPIKGTIDLPIGRDPRNRLRMSIKGRDGKAARTHYRILKTYRDACALVECRLESGRTHQIRVHMAHIHCPLLGDPAYGKSGGFKTANSDSEMKLKAALSRFNRQALHAKSLGFKHPVTKAEMYFETDLPADMLTLESALCEL